jgi:ABC-2 type transport system ATP-binding protein
VIAAASLSRAFGGRTVVDHVSFDVRPGEIVALLGPNGAGKTTTMRMLAGLVSPTSGTVTIDGVELTRATGSALRARIGFLTESPGLWDRLTVRENLGVYAAIYGIGDARRVIDGALDMFGLGARASSRAAELSKGMRQKVALVRAMLHSPSILLLDEPTSGLDPEITRSVRRLLEDRRAAGCAILVSTHNLDEAERLADRVAVLHGRLIALDRPGALRQRLMTGRVLVRLAGAPDPYLPSARAFDPAAEVEGGAIALTLPRAEEDAPKLVRALIDAGADLIEVRHEMPALEDVYLRLVAARSGTTP